MYLRRVPKILKMFSRSVYAKPKEPFRQAFASDILKRTLEESTIKNVEDWKQFRELILNANHPRQSITVKNIDAMTLGVCTSLKKYDLANSYLEFLNKEKIELNLATTGKYLRLLYLKNKDLDKATPEDQQLIYDLYDQLTKAYPILDQLTADCVIVALSVTDKWRECLHKITEVESTGSLTATSHSATIAAAFRNGEHELGWKLLNTMLENQRPPEDTVFSTYFRIASSNKSYLVKMLNFISENQIILRQEAVDSLKTSLKCVNLTAKDAPILKNGFCCVCKNKLQKFDLSDEEFKTLKDKVLNNVIIGKNIFYKSTPVELEKFQDFIKNLKPHDVVIDGLNVAYSTGAPKSLHVTSTLVAAVVSNFASTGQKVLLLGRDHMRKYPTKTWNHIQQNATVFLTQNLSHDDPYLLYCALHCGKNTIIVTKDLMRSHKFLMPTLQDKNLFDRWLAQRQYQLIHVKQDGKPLFKLPPNYSCVAQKSGKYWHLPYETSHQNKELSWICLETR